MVFYRHKDESGTQEISLLDRYKSLEKNTIESLKEIKENLTIQNIKKVLINTPIEVAICAALGLGISSTIAYKNEANRSHFYPLGFSEKSQIEKDARYQGGSVGPITKYLTSVNDACMKVFEAWNLSYSQSIIPPTKKQQAERFARELELKIGNDFRIHRYQLDDLLRNLPNEARDVKSSLADVFNTKSSLAVVNANFDKSWDDDHYDHYRIEVYPDTEISTDSNGNTITTTVLKTRQVYDHTTHTYTYHKKAGEEASRSLDQLIRNCPELRLREKIRTASQTNADGEYAAERSRKRELKGRRLNDEELKKLANTWRSGSTLLRVMPEIERLYNNELHKDADLWRSSKRTARSDEYDTYSQSDPGPKEFQVAEETLEDGIMLSRKIERVKRGIDYTESNSSLLDSLAREIIAVELDHKKGNSRKLMKEIRKTAENMYIYNFENGFDVKRFRGEVVFLIALLGLGLGTGVGAGINYLGEKYNLYREKID